VPATQDDTVPLSAASVMNRMAELIHEHSTHMRTREGQVFVARTYGEKQSDGLWEGWLEFHPIGGVGPVLKTGRETGQSSRAAMENWSLGLEGVYLQGAFARAKIVPAR
jgi:hypothetical protein